jgi:hypothetical protein
MPQNNLFFKVPKKNMKNIHSKTYIQPEKKNAQEIKSHLLGRKRRHKMSDCNFKKTKKTLVKSLYHLNLSPLLF